LEVYKYRLELGASVILATQEAEIRRIAVRSQSGQIVCEKKMPVEWFKV
jgi:hypothetical protein